MVDGDGDVPVSVNAIKWPAMEATGQMRVSLAAECDSAETSGR